jgi:hypothetical protein
MEEKIEVGKRKPPHSPQPTNTAFWKLNNSISDPAGKSTILDEVLTEHLPRKTKINSERSKNTARLLEMASAFRMVRSINPRHGSALRNSNRSRRAFSLIEVMVALGIVMFAVVPMVALPPVAQMTYSASKRATIYANIMQQLNNEANLANFSTLASLDTSHYL